MAKRGNPYHDALGRFTSGSGVGFGSRGGFASSGNSSLAKRIPVQMRKTVVPLTKGKVNTAHKRIEKLTNKLGRLEAQPRGEDQRKAVKSTQVAIKRWKDILAGRPIH